MKSQLAVIIFILSACSTFEREPIAPATHIPISAIWSQIIDREVLYTPRPNIIVNDGVFETEYTFSHSVNASFVKGQVAVIYENYSNPFSLDLKIVPMDNSIEKFAIKECIVKVANKNKVNLITSLSDYTICRKSKEGDVRWSEKTGLSENYTVELKENDPGSVNTVFLHFSDIQIDFEIISDFVLKSSFVIYMKNGEHFEIAHQTEYARTIIETKMHHFLRNPFQSDDNSVKEITIEEWKRLK
ncbi:MAG: hypothetical protein JXK07_01285 [Spirochaetes bacterium]|nr:hypothetical protein [Spirochaetota bacterium]MBN2771474.1 hypothetical protein [Spirochaetota bacterium]